MWIWATLVSPVAAVLPQSILLHIPWGFITRNFFLICSLCPSIPFLFPTFSSNPLYCELIMCPPKCH
ncbi:hypothetical protein XELAEV_18013915mg [Xenopus laevis]|uniref:Uncharacterized protein n=1 Tax=Xenopus laevis TaxID=8355 RepID=A0A974DRL5_XENLA|nr:hypothetical protein XELAEV_18013915mg [Xenopus laevis]